MCVRVQGRLSPLLRASPHPRPPRRSGSPESRRGGHPWEKLIFRGGSSPEWPQPYHNPSHPFPDPRGDPSPLRPPHGRAPRGDREALGQGAPIL